MAGIWDSNLKRLVGANPQHFVTWLLAGAQVIRELSAHLNRAIDIDILYEVMLNSQRVASHLEFQRYRDLDMAKRILEYNVFASCKFDCTVISFVIYLKKDGNIIESPLILTLPDDREILRFNFITIKLWEIATDELRRTGSAGLLPLLPLTREGATQEVVEEVVTKLLDLEDRSTQTNLLSITFNLASLAFDAPEDKDWLLRRFKMFQDILRDTEIYQYIMQEGLAEGIQQGIQQGVQQELQDLRLTIIRMVQARFPKLASFAIEQTASIEDPLRLQDLIVDISAAQTADQVRQLLAEVGNKNNK
jgi:predicted transposase YdaD